MKYSSEGEWDGGMEAIWQLMRWPSSENPDWRKFWDKIWENETRLCLAGLPPLPSLPLRRDRAFPFVIKADKIRGGGQWDAIMDGGGRAAATTATAARRTRKLTQTIAAGEADTLIAILIYTF